MFQSVSSELLNLASAYGKIVNRNQLVYGPFYVPLLREVLSKLLNYSVFKNRQKCGRLR